VDQQAPEHDPYAAQASPSRRRLLALLRDADEAQDAHQLAAATALHVTTVRFHLRILEQAGLVLSRVRRPRAAGRPRTEYEATTPAPATGGAYRELAAVLAAHLGETAAGRAARAERAGVAWAGRLPLGSPKPTAPEAAAEVTRLCAEMGFDPELVARDGGWRIDLRACPFLSVAREHPDVVCSVHLGLIRGTLDRVGAPPLASRLVPFAEPGLCVAQLDRVEAF
jgi:predicted ArsR family transcriptional regulator